MADEKRPKFTAEQQAEFDATMERFAAACKEEDKAQRKTAADSYLDPLREALREGDCAGWPSKDAEKAAVSALVEELKRFAETEARLTEFGRLTDGHGPIEVTLEHAGLRSRVAAFEDVDDRSQTTPDDSDPTPPDHTKA
jgi:hypothetical protein